MIEKIPFESSSQISLYCLGATWLGMVRIAWVAIGVNISFTIFAFQVLEEGSKSWYTLIGSWVYSSTFGCGLKPSIYGTHGSVQTLIDFPSLSKKKAPFLMRFLVASIAFHVEDATLIFCLFETKATHAFRIEEFVPRIPGNEPTIFIFGLPPKSPR